MSDPRCTCVEGGMCAKHDVQTPAEDLYMMVDGLRRKLHSQPLTLTPLGEACVDPESYIL